MKRNTQTTVTQTATNNQTATTTTVPFTLKFPPALDIKPEHVVPLSKNYTAFVYKVEKDEYNRVTGDVMKGRTVTTYVTRVRHNTSQLPPHRGNYNYYRDNTCTCLVEVRSMLELYAADLAPKTKTTTVVQEED